MFLLGSPRGGTTWLAEVLCRVAHYRQIFEPLHHDVEAAAIIRRKGGPKLYLRPGTEDPEIRAFFGSVLEGRFRHPICDGFNTYRFPKGRLVKLIRGNLLAGWLRTQFPDVPQVILLRHPCAVAYSACQLGYMQSLEALHGLLRQTDLMADHLEPYRALMEATREIFPILIIRWCIDTLIPLRQFSDEGVPIVFYENLFAEPERHFPPLFEALGLRWDPRSLESVRQPSNTSWGDHSGMKSGRSPISNWRDKVEPAQIDQAVRILHEFGLDVLYDDDPMPRAENLPRVRAAQTAARTH